jgi:hypothetical protein
MKTGRTGRQNPKVLVRNRDSEEVVEMASLSSLKVKEVIKTMYII